MFGSGCTATGRLVRLSLHGVSSNRPGACGMPVSILWLLSVSCKSGADRIASREQLQSSRAVHLGSARLGMLVVCEETPDGQAGRNLCWPPTHLRPGFVLSRLAVGWDSGCRCPVASCHRHSAAYPMLVMAHTGRNLADSLSRVCPARSHSTSWLVRIPANENIRPGQ